MSSPASRRGGTGSGLGGLLRPGNHSSAARRGRQDGYARSNLSRMRQDGHCLPVAFRDSDLHAALAAGGGPGLPAQPPADIARADGARGQDWGWCRHRHPPRALAEISSRQALRPSASAAQPGHRRCHSLTDGTATQRSATARISKRLTFSGQVSGQREERAVLRRELFVRGSQVGRLPSGAFALALILVGGLERVPRSDGLKRAAKRDILHEGTHQRVRVDAERVGQRPADAAPCFDRIEPGYMYAWASPAPTPVSR